MPKAEKDPLPESESPAAVSLDRQMGADSEVSEFSAVDVDKVVRQQLDSLRRAGLTYLPKGTGQYDFDFPAEMAARDDSNQAASQPPRKEPSNLAVGESKQRFSAEPDSASTDGAKPDVSTIEPVTAATKPTPEPEPAQRDAKPASNQTRMVDSNPYNARLGLAERQTALKVLQDEVAGCTQCKELAQSRTQTVFGVGNPSARLVFLGEGPGVNEDRLGEPFVGEAGLLLDKIMGACKLTRADVYILNTVKCRPPANRNPSQDELANCWGYAERQLEILQPEFICCLGSVAARTLLKTTQAIGRLRRQFHSYRGSRVLVTYHPAYLLRTPSAKKHVWEDMKLLMKEMGVDLSI